MPSPSSSTVTTTARTTLGLPVERFEQLKSLAAARELAPAALVEEWITRAVADGEPGAIELPGYGVFRDDNVIVVTIAGRNLPMLPIRDALKLSVLLDAAAPMGGQTMPVNMRGPFTLSLGANVPLPLGPVTLTVGRKGRGVAFDLTENATAKTDRFTAPPSYVADLACMIRNAVDGH